MRNTKSNQVHAGELPATPYGVTAEVRRNYAAWLAKRGEQPKEAGMTAKYKKRLANRRKLI